MNIYQIGFYFIIDKIMSSLRALLIKNPCTHFKRRIRPHGTTDEYAVMTTHLRSGIRMIARW